MKCAFLTTIDNPYDPYEQFDQWFAYDNFHGYNTCGYLDKIARTSPDASMEDNCFAVEAAIDEIVALNIGGMYKKVIKEVEDLRPD